MMRLLVVIALLVAATNGQPESNVYNSMHEQTRAKRASDCSGGNQPNILFFLADDLGWNDVSWHNSEVTTPRMQEMASSGLILDRMYGQNVCSPSRASLMTGIYAHKLGVQHAVLGSATPECLYPPQDLISDSLRELGYINHYLGKWHLGYCSPYCLPDNRGFDSFYGFYNGYISHYDHEFFGFYDWRDNLEPGVSLKGQYAQDLLTERAVEIIQNHDGSSPLFMFMAHPLVHSPLEPPPGVAGVDPNTSDPAGEGRRVYLEMVKAMDGAIGTIVDALKSNGLYDNSIIIFSSDNGGEEGPASNMPLRGAKTSVFEGGIRVAGFVHSPLMEDPGRTMDGVEGTMHFIDWYPTIYSMAGGCAPEDLGWPNPIDGIDNSQLILHGQNSLRTDFVVQLDDLDPAPFGNAAIRKGQYKLVYGYPGLYDGWEQDGNLELTHLVDALGVSGGQERKKRSDYTFDWAAIGAYAAACKAHDPWLFDVIADPEERNNIADQHPDIVAELYAIIQESYATEMAEIDEERLQDSANAYAYLYTDPSSGDRYWQTGWCG